MFLRTEQAGALIQMPVFVLLFLAPVYVPIDLLTGWIHDVGEVQPGPRRRSRRVAGCWRVRRSRWRWRSRSSPAPHWCWPVFARRGLAKRRARGLRLDRCWNARKLDEASLAPNARIAGATPMFDWIGSEGVAVFSY